MSGILLAAGIACATAGNRPEAAAPDPPGRMIYANKCQGCHRLYRPSRESADRWPVILQKMGARAKLTPEEADAVLAYLVEASTPSH